MGNGGIEDLVVEDEPDIRKLVHYNLTQDHCEELSKKLKAATMRLNLFSANKNSSR